jgi:signal transduction histidine kinase/CheY-like chemotaxis protein
MAIYGRPREAIVGARVEDFAPPERRAAAVAAWEAFVAAGEQSGVFEVRRPDGTARHAEYRARAHFIPGHHLSVLRDVSEQRHAEEARRESDDRLASVTRLQTAILDALPAHIAVLDSAGTIVAVNEAWRRFARVNAMHHPALGVGLSYLEVCRRAAEAGAGEAERVLQGLMAVLAGEEPQLELEYPCHAPDQNRWFRLMVTPLRSGQGGDAAGAVAMHLDVSKRRQAEDENARLFAEMLAAGRSKDEFLAMLAHELRNPLSPMLHAIELLRQRGGDDAVRGRALEMLGRQARNMARLIEDLLDASRITRGRIELQLEPVEVGALAARVLEATAPAIEARGHHLAVELPPEPIWLAADPIRLEQILANLLNNAAKFTPPGGRIEVAVAREPEAVALSVRDDGEGIPAELLPRIFDLFVQADQSLARSHGGLGIGLSLVRSLVGLHGGSVTARSDGPGRGSEFVVRLPADGAAAPRPESSRGAASAEPRSLRILVVEDNPDTAASLAELLRMWGHDTRVATDGPSALALAPGFRPEVVVLDIGLPGMDGYELAVALGREEILPRPYLVALTGYGQRQDRERARRAGIDRHLTKPADLAQLRELLAEAGTAVPPPPPASA